MGRRKEQPAEPSGLLVVDKPQGLTSHDVVSRMRRLAGTRRVGHAGTLDPMATGVLIIGVNQATKLLTWLAGESKTYSATIRLGVSTVTDDAEGEPTGSAPAGAVEAITPEDLRREVARLTGRIQQVPSAVSAIKVDGKRSYARVRAGEEVTLKARPVTVSRFEIHQARTLTLETGERVVDLEATVDCSSGTYIRALARDLGEALGVGGHLTRLRRDAIGQVRREDAVSLEELAAAREDGRELPLLGLEEAAERLFGRRDLDAEEATRLSNGRWIAPSRDQTEAGAEAAAGAQTGTDDGAAAQPAGKPAGQEPAAEAGSRKGGVVPAHRLTACFAPDGTLVALSEDQRRRGARYAVPHLVFAAGRSFAEASAQTEARP